MSLSHTTEPVIAVELNLPGELLRQIDALACSGTDRSVRGDRDLARQAPHHTC